MLFLPKAKNKKSNFKLKIHIFKNYKIELSSCKRLFKMTRRPTRSKLLLSNTFNSKLKFKAMKELLLLKSPLLL
jgi:hypothetical protein